MDKRKLWNLISAPGLAVTSLLFVFLLLGWHTAGATQEGDGTVSGIRYPGATWSSLADETSVTPLATPAPNTLSVSQVGYRAQDAKQGVLLMGAASPVTTFNALAGEQAVFTGTLQAWGMIWGLNAWVADFSPLEAPGYYHLKVGSLTSTHFYIAPEAYLLLDPPDEIITGSVFPDAIFDSFFDYQRSIADDRNLPVHTLTADGEVSTGTEWLDASGGWNDAASHDKETVSIAWTTQLLALALERNEAYFDVHPRTRQKILSEIQWGADWLLKIQDVDGGMLLAVKPPEGDLPRRVLRNKGTGVTAKAAAAFATAARVFADENPITYTTYLSAAEAAWGWVESHPNQFISTTVYPSYWTGKSPSKILATVELYYAFITADIPKAQSYLTQAISYTSAGAFDYDCAWRDGSDGQTTDFRNAAIEEQAIVALARLYQAPDATSDVRSHISDELRSWYGLACCR
jgi:endoglucanase